MARGVPAGSSTARVTVGVAAVVLLVASSQVQLLWVAVEHWVPGSWRGARRLAAVAAVAVLVASRRFVAGFRVPRPPRPRYGWRARLVVLAAGMFGMVGVATAAGGIVDALFSLPAREACRPPGGVVERLVDGSLVPGVWEELLWRVAVLGVLLRVTGPRRAVVLQAVAFAVAHTAWGLGLGLVTPACAGNQYLLGSAMDVAISGLVLGVLVVELGSVWPAVIAHAASNAIGDSWVGYPVIVVSCLAWGAVVSSGVGQARVRAWVGHRSRSQPARPGASAAVPTSPGSGNGRCGTASPGPPATGQRRSGRTGRRPGPVRNAPLVDLLPA